MSEDDKASKTEDPTAKRITDAMAKGQVAKSQEINHLFNLVGGFIVFWLLAESMVGLLKTDLTYYIARSEQIPLSGRGARDVLMQVSSAIFMATLPSVILLVVLAIIASRLQHPFLWVPNKIKPDFNQLMKKLNLVTGLRNKFKLQALIDFGKSMAKFIIIIPVIYLVVQPFFDGLYNVITLNLYDFLYSFYNDHLME